MQVGKYTMLEKVYSNMGVGGKADNSWQVVSVTDHVKFDTIWLHYFHSLKLQLHTPFHIIGQSSYPLRLHTVENQPWIIDNLVLKFGMWRSQQDCLQLSVEQAAAAYLKLLPTDGIQVSLNPFRLYDDPMVIAIYFRAVRQLKSGWMHIFTKKCCNPNITLSKISFFAINGCLQENSQHLFTMLA